MFHLLLSLSQRPLTEHLLSPTNSIRYLRYPHRDGDLGNTSVLGEATKARRRSLRSAGVKPPGPAPRAGKWGRWALTRVLVHKMCVFPSHLRFTASIVHLIQLIKWCSVGEEETICG